MPRNPPPAPTDLALAGRTGLPDELRVLLADYPRDGWSARPDFNGLVSFWLERHLDFRTLMTAMQADAALVLDRAIAPEAYRRRLSRQGSTFVQSLLGHHQIEDAHYFPQLAAMEQRLQRGFDMLDRDHHDLDGWLHRFVDGANAVLADDADDAALREAVGRFRGELDGFAPMLERHLTDEEDLILPVILKHRVG